jgi:hypothetical protein
MRKIMLTTALVAAASASYAGSHSTSVFIQSGDDMNIPAELVATNLIGMRIYSSDAAPSEEDGVMEISDKWEDIGEVKDLILARDGSVEAVILDIGGFLGLGERQVAMKMSDIKFVNDKDDDEFFMVVEASGEELENAPEFDLAAIGAWHSIDIDAEEAGEAVEQAAADTGQAIEETAAEAEAVAEIAAAETENALETAAAETEQAVEETAAETQAVAENAAEATQETMEAAAVELGNEAANPMVDRDGYTTVVVNDLNTEDLTGARLYDSSDADIGEISELLIDKEGKIDQAVLDVGGFLGLGEHSVAMDIEKLDIQADDSTGEIRVFIDLSKEELESMQQYDG